MCESVLSVREWDEKHAQPDPNEFVRAILPSLLGVPIQRMVEATGLSLRYCSLIRRGLRVPHPRHWSAFLGTSPDLST